MRKGWEDLDEDDHVHSSFLVTVNTNAMQVLRCCDFYVRYDLAEAFFRRIWKSQGKESTSTVT